MQVVSEDSVVLVESTFNYYDTPFVLDPIKLFHNGHYASTCQARRSFCYNVTDVGHHLPRKWSTVADLNKQMKHMIPEFSSMSVSHLLPDGPQTCLGASQPYPGICKTRHRVPKQGGFLSHPQQDSLHNLSQKRIGCLQLKSVRKRLYSTSGIGAFSIQFSVELANGKMGVDETSPVHVENLQN